MRGESVRKRLLLREKGRLQPSELGRMFRRSSDAQLSVLWVM